MSQNDPQQKTPHQFVVMFGTALTDCMWQVIEFAIKAGLIMLFWNGFLASALSLPALAFGTAFALVAVVTILFSNLNGHSKFHTRHLFDLKNLVYQLVVNQHTQNNTIMSLLSRSSNQSTENENIVSKPKEKVDEDDKNDYNTEESEKK